jgi:glycosyltransferase involved in cell wall biosynthesis
MKGPQATVCVPVKDRRDRMLRCLDALLALDHPSYEVLVLDNGSSDGTVQACRERAADAGVPVRVETVEGTVGRVRNVGARLARGEVVAYTDSDCMADPGWLREGVRPFEDPSVGVVTGRTLPEVPGPYEPWQATIEVTEFTGRFESCNLFFRRAGLLATAGFDEEVGHLWEDTPAGWGMVLDGWRAAYAEGAVVRHDVTYPGLAWHLRRARKYGHAAASIRRYPQLREELLWHRFFVGPRNAAAAAAAAGVLLSALDRRALGLAAPWAWRRLPRRARWSDVRSSAENALFDLAVLGGMVEGSVRWRRLVL